MIHTTYIIYTSSAKEATFSLPKLVLRFLAGGNSWNVNGKSQNCGAEAQEYGVKSFLTIRCLHV